MSTTIFKIDKFDINDIISIDQKVTDKRYLVFDLRTKNTNIKESGQILIQINDLEIINKSYDTIYFDITDKQVIENKLNSIEEKILAILRQYLKHHNKKGSFEFNSLIKSNENNQKIISFNLVNDDYPINCFDKNKTKISMDDLQQNTYCNIVIEIMYMYLDMIKGSIVIDSRLRLIIENKIIQKREQITNIDLFIEDENDSVSEENISSNIYNIENSFDITKTEHFEENSDTEESADNTKHTISSEDEVYQMSSDDE